MKRFSRKLALLLCALLTLSVSLPAFAAAKSEAAASVTLSVEGGSAAEEGFVLYAKAQGLPSGAKVLYDFLVKKPGAEKYVYLKKDSASSSLCYCPKEEGAYAFRVRLHENGASEYVASSAVSAVLGNAASEGPAVSAGPKWNPAAGYPSLPETITSLDELFNGVNRAVVTYRTMPTIQVRYLQLQKF